MNDDIETQASSLLSEIAELLKLRGENIFKIRAYQKASEVILKQKNLVSRIDRLEEIDGIGKGIAQVLKEFLTTGKSRALEELKSEISPVILELTKISGLGPKKAQFLVDTLEIHSLGELEYACRENRLVNLKGFGEKQQAKILEGIEFLKSTEGQLKLSDALLWSKKVENFLRSLNLSFLEVGELRRKLEIIKTIEFLVELEASSAQSEKIKSELNRFVKKEKIPLSVEFHFISKQNTAFGTECLRLSASKAHLKKLETLRTSLPQAKTEEECYQKLNLAFIPPECRETGREIELAKKGKFEFLISDQLQNALQGVFHNHTTRSDGIHSLEEMVSHARSLGFSYIGISDHSQSATYAKGLKLSELNAQEKEIRLLQEKYPEIKIFWGIESDILADGSLDYDSATLKRFDFVIASIHSRFQMDRQTMTDRILKAIRNPFTRFLGHPTGRLLLGRKPYELDLEQVIEEAAKCGVAIELNCNPARLDVDWRYGECLTSTDAWVSIAPDAHDKSGLSDVQYGLWMARKALLNQKRIVNAQSVKAVTAWLNQT